jgi:signal transduction histidine kinase
MTFGRVNPRKSGVFWTLDGTESKLAAPVSSCFAGYHGHSGGDRGLKPGPASRFSSKGPNPPLAQRLRYLQLCVLAHCETGEEDVPPVAASDSRNCLGIADGQLHLQRGSEGALLVVVAGQLATVFSLPVSLSWVGGQTLLMGLVIRSHFSLEIALVLSVSWLGFQVFAVLMSQAAAREAMARIDLSKLNAELRATQQLLVDSSQVAERMRIARELHDVVGHHLTGLSLNLEVASHLINGKAQEHIQTAQSVTKLLLQDVREVVNTLRGDDSFDLGRAIRTLTKDIPMPRIHLAVPEDLGIYDPVRAETILRCVQEIITNAVRHSSAQNLWIESVKTVEGVEVRARDDGSGVKQLRAGNGLTGMRERVEQVGGLLEIESTPGTGFRLKLRIPTAASSA